MAFFKNLFSKKNSEIEVLAPIDGEIIPLEKVKDEAFAQKMLGDGFAIKPKGKNFISPISGKMVTVFPTGHAFGVKHASGIEMLLHIGMDTVSLNGKGFTIKVSLDQNINAGTELCEVDLEAIKGSVPSLDTPIVFTPESMKNHQIEIIKKGKVKQGDVVAIIKSK